MLLLAAPLVGASPYVGASLPELDGQALSGATFHSTSLRGRPSLVVIVTSRSAAAHAKAWFERAHALGLSALVKPVALISIRAPFFVPASYLRTKAQSAIPNRYWGDVVLDGGEIADRLGVGEENEPLALAIDPAGRIRAVAHATPDTEAGQRVFAALGH